MKRYDLIQIGVDYYPEHWEESMWEPDIRLMKETGFKVVRVAELWSRLEPMEGNYQFGWLDRVLDLFHKYELQVVIGTPTATPPRWLTTKFPDVLPVFAIGETFHPGVRGDRIFRTPIRLGGLRVTISHMPLLMSSTQWWAPSHNFV